MTPETCPHCGADVPPNAKACPECGSDENTGWSDTAYADRLGLPDENFDYQQFVKREFEGERVGSSSIRRFWWLIAVLLLAAIVMVVLGRFWR